MEKNKKRIKIEDAELELLNLSKKIADLLTEIVNVEFELKYGNPDEKRIKEIFDNADRLLYSIMFLSVDIMDYNDYLRAKMRKKVRKWKTMKKGKSGQKQHIE